ncbi:hypothetical protein [Streptomyces sp. NPDC048155]|uniref:hypothetical protein n=1 Tax=Streptomyces sp. NPDC048155 TaxID=3154818 RepID=UPI0034094FA0
MTATRLYGTATARAWDRLHPRLTHRSAPGAGQELPAGHEPRRSTSILAGEGNAGGVSVLRILERTHATPPPVGAIGVAVAYGPGFATAALRVTWQD